jgi:hypothetical protein
MEPDLQISVKGLPEDLALNIGNTIAGIIKAFKEVDENLDFRRMHRIVVTADFAGELAELSTPTSSSGDQITHTNEDYAVAVAKVMAIPNGDKFEFLPIINAQYAAALAPEDAEGYDSDNFKYILHLLHHELCHVHDGNKKIDALDNLILTQHKGKDTFIIPLSSSCWSEYIANFLSSKTATNANLKDTVTSLEDAVKRTKGVIDNEILLYRYHGDLGKLIAIFKRHGEFLVKSAAYTLGYMDGLGVTLEELSPEASKIILGSYFESTWKAMHEALKEMRKSYPENWKDSSIYNSLSVVLENYYDKMGLILSNTEDGEAYVDIPFRAETTPNL